MNNDGEMGVRRCKIQLRGVIGWDGEEEYTLSAITYGVSDKFEEFRGIIKEQAEELALQRSAYKRSADDVARLHKELSDVCDASLAQKVEAIKLRGEIEQLKAENKEILTTHNAHWCATNQELKAENQRLKKHCAEYIWGEDNPEVYEGELARYLRINKLHEEEIVRLQELLKQFAKPASDFGIVGEHACVVIGCQNEGVIYSSSFQTGVVYRCEEHYHDDKGKDTSPEGCDT